MVERRIPGHITGLYIFAVINLCALLNISLVNADIYVIDTEKNHTIATMDDKQASFGTDFPDNGLTGRLIYVVPHNACTFVHPPPREPNDLPWIALIARGPCHFDEKVYNAMNSSYKAAIVHNVDGDDSLVQMGGGAYSDKIQIPSVFVGYTDGMNLAEHYTFNNSRLTIHIKIVEEPEASLKDYFIPFTIVVSVTFLAIIIFSVFKCVQHCRFERKTKLSKKALKKIPTQKYKKGDHYDVCAICLEDYEEGEKLRVLPCGHTYHCKCIDPWLTERRKTCPQCKRRVVPKQNPESESEEEDVERDGANENTPLLGSSSSPGQLGSSRSGSMGRTRASTFQRSGLPESVQPEVVVISGGRRISSSSEDEDGSDSANEEGAVDGVEVTDKPEQNCLPAEEEAATVSEVDETVGATGADALSESAAILTTDQKPGATRVCSPARDEGSINVGFTSSTSSTSSEEEGVLVEKKSKKKKHRSNVV